jgi:aconitate hydratase
VLLSGRIRPFVSARDVALEMLRLGVKERVGAVFEKCQAPVVLEFGGPSTQFLTVGDRSILAAMAPHLGAAAALFESDEKTDAFLRMQRRSKAHRALSSDPGAPWEDIVSLDLASVNPLVMDEEHNVRPVRDLEGRAIDQVLLGGDSGVSLRDYFAVAALIKSKRVAPGVDFLLCPPSRQTLEVLAAGPLADLVTTGARIVEPDARVLSGEFYTPDANDRALKTCDHRETPWGMIASAETVALALTTGDLADPRHFKRPARVAVPRVLPTDDVLISREKEARSTTKTRQRLGERSSTPSQRLPASAEHSLMEVEEEALSEELESFASRHE